MVSISNLEVKFLRNSLKVSGVGKLLGYRYLEQLYAAPIINVLILCMVNHAMAIYITYVKSPLRMCCILYAWQGN